jgi:hypothetical protein
MSEPIRRGRLGVHELHPTEEQYREMLQMGETRFPKRVRKMAQGFEYKEMGKMEVEDALSAQNRTIDGLAQRLDDAECSLAD